MTTEITQTCKKFVNDGSYRSRQCGKKVKGQTDAGEWLCGIHLGAYNRVKKNRAADKAQHEHDTDINDRTRQILAALTDQYGIAGHLYYGRYGNNCSGDVVVSAQQLQEILTKLTTN